LTDTGVASIHEYHEYCGRYPLTPPTTIRSGVVQWQDARFWSLKRGFDTFLPNHLKGGDSMRHDRLKLVVPEDGAPAATDRSTELLGTPAPPDSAVRRLHVVDADEGPLPDDAA
jgi:hypothetical protein